MRTFITILLYCLTQLVCSQKKQALRFVKEIILPANTRVDLRHFWRDSTDIQCSDQSYLMDVIKDATYTDSMYINMEAQTFYVYQNQIESELELMKALGEKDGIDISTPEGLTEIRHRLALMAWLSRDFPDYSIIQHKDYLLLIWFGYMRLKNDLIILPKLVSDKMDPIGWFLDANPQSGSKRADGVYWFISRKKPTRQQLKYRQAD